MWLWKDNECVWCLYTMSVVGVLKKMLPGDSFVQWGTSTFMWATVEKSAVEWLGGMACLIWTSMVIWLEFSGSHGLSIINTIFKFGVAQKCAECLLSKQPEKVFLGLLAVTIYSCKDTGGVMGVCFVDSEKAYDHVTLSNWWRVLEKYEVLEQLLQSFSPGTE